MRLNSTLLCQDNFIKIGCRFVSICIQISTHYIRMCITVKHIVLVRNIQFIICTAWVYGIYIHTTVARRDSFVTLNSTYIILRNKTKVISECTFLSTPLPSDNFCMKYELCVLCLTSLDATRMRKYLTNTASIHVPRFHFLARIIRVIQFVPHDCVLPSITTSCLSNSSLCNGMQIIMETTWSFKSMTCDMAGERWANYYGVDPMRY